MTMLQLILTNPGAIEEWQVPCPLKGLHWLLAREQEQLVNALQKRLQLERVPLLPDRRAA
jgi:hypothetical protein